LACSPVKDEKERDDSLEEDSGREVENDVHKVQVSILKGGGGKDGGIGLIEHTGLQREKEECRALSGLKGEQTVHGQGCCWTLCGEGETRNTVDGTNLKEKHHRVLGFEWAKSKRGDK